MSEDKKDHLQMQVVDALMFVRFGISNGRIEPALKILDDVIEHLKALQGLPEVEQGPGGGQKVENL